MRAHCSRADLVRLLGARTHGLLDRCAGMLGFEHRPPPPQAKAESLLVAPAQAAQGALEPSGAPPLAVRDFLQVAACRTVAEETAPAPASGRPPWEMGERGDVLAFPEASPLEPWPRLWRRLRPHLSELLPSSEVDVAALVRSLGRSETVPRLPRLSRARLAKRPLVVIDRARRQLPFWSDQDAVCRALARWTKRTSAGGDGGRVVMVVGGDQPAERLALGAPGRPPPDYRGAVVLLLGDLGAFGGEAERREWREAGERLRHQGARLRSLVPSPSWRVDKKLASLWNAMAWKAGERDAPPVKVEKRVERARRLLALLAPAIRIELGLLRAARALLPGETDSGTEADVVGHPAIAGHSSVALTLEPKAKKELEAEFDGLDEGLRRKAIALLAKWHSALPPEILKEEKFHLARRLPQQILFSGDAEEEAIERRELDRFVLELLEAVDRIDASPRDNLPAGVISWTRELLEDRLSKELYLDKTLGGPLSRAWAVVNRHKRGEFPPGFGPEELQIIHRGSKSAPIRCWCLWQVGDSLVVRPGGEPRGATRLAHRPSLGAAAVGSPVGELRAAEPRLLVSVRGHRASEHDLRNEASPIRLPEDGEDWTLATDRQGLTLRAIEKPVWARRAGRDAYGLWSEFEYQGVAQRMRWIDPGRFWMGSPENEPERSSDELLHEEELTEGFWLADTACTQELWVAVMRKNPSRFGEPEPEARARPVERVSWDDCQEFLGRLTREIRGLDLELPTEAEWEYACRAGTQTPFSFGANITPDQVNYRGNYPYAGGRKGSYRETTVAVKSLPPNAWGLYEMHGNVWEWCLDDCAEYEPGLDVNPPGSAEDGAGVCLRVVRGGSWRSDARSARSAYRYRLPPGDRVSLLGFRVARSRHSKLVRPAGGSGGSERPGEPSGAKATSGPRATEVGSGPEVQSSSADGERRGSRRRPPGKRGRR